MNRLLSNVWKKPGTANGMKPQTEGIDTIGKTGTTSDFKDYTRSEEHTSELQSQR